ncbi:MAG TPA: SRPBCC family protein [Cyclobacteriaceae bacterium]
MTDTLLNIAKKGKVNPDASLHDQQEIIIYAPIDKVWKILTNVNEWPQWNKDISDTKPGQLKVGERFKWKINNITVNSEIALVEEPHTWSWKGEMLWHKAIHLWKLIKLDESQTAVMVEESMQGFMVTLFMSHYKLHKVLIDWLERLKTKAEKG